MGMHNVNPVCSRHNNMLDPVLYMHWVVLHNCIIIISNSLKIIYTYMQLLCETDNENLIDDVLDYIIKIKDNTLHCDTIIPSQRSIIHTTVNDVLSIALEKSVPKVNMMMMHVPLIFILQFIHACTLIARGIIA